ELQPVWRYVCLRRQFDKNKIETWNVGIRIVEGHGQATARDDFFQLLEQLFTGEVVITPSIERLHLVDGIREPVANLIEVISDNGERRIVWISRIFVVIFAIQKTGQFQQVVQALRALQVFEEQEIKNSPRDFSSRNADVN